MPCTIPIFTPVSGTSASDTLVVGVDTDYDDSEIEYVLGIGSKQNCIWVLSITDTYIATEDGFPILGEQYATDDPLVTE